MSQVFFFQTNYSFICFKCTFSKWINAREFCNLRLWKSDCKTIVRITRHLQTTPKQNSNKLYNVYFHSKPGLALSLPINSIQSKANSFLVFYSVQSFAVYIFHQDIFFHRWHSNLGLFLFYLVHKIISFSRRIPSNCIVSYIISFSIRY